MVNTRNPGFEFVVEDWNFFFIFLQKVGMWNFEKVCQKLEKEMMKSFVQLAS